MFNKLISKKQFADLLKDDMVLMVGGFLGCGSPEALIDIIIEKRVKNLTIICNDTSFPDRGIGRLVAEKLVGRVLTSHIGTNPETGRQMVEGTIKVELIPQGTLIERIRAGGMGLGGFLTPTGVGTVVEEGKQKMTIDGREYLLELPLRADLALVKGGTVDKAGNVIYHGTARNFNPVIAFAAETVVAEAGKLVEIGSLNPESIVTPAPLIDHVFVPGQS
ncbi:MAG: acetate CoA-transferase subunit alpha [Candidatus Rifleibacteriota bacterium]